MANVTAGAVVELRNPIFRGNGLVTQVDLSRPNPVAVRMGRRTVWAKIEGVSLLFAATHPIARMHAGSL